VIDASRACHNLGLYTAAAIDGARVGGGCKLH
jgi:enoyl-CoA hydratase/carnithine racemase